MKEKTKVKKMFILDGGSFLFDTGLMLFDENLGVEQRIIVTMFAFDTEDGWVLYDTGWPMEAVPVLAKMGREPHITEENFVVNQLKHIGVKPEDVSKVILSHMHLDHAGSVKFFPDAKIYVQKDEFAYAKYPNSFQAGAYGVGVFEFPDMKWEILQGDAVIMPGLTTILSSGHTPGLQGLVVELPETGYCLLSGDSAYLETNIEKDHPPGLVWNTVLAQYAITRFKALKSILGAQFFPGHDYNFYQNKAKLGEPYF